MQPAALAGLEADRFDSESGADGRGRREQLAHGLAGNSIHLERALNPLGIVAVNAARRLRIQHSQARVHCLHAQALHFLLQLCAYRRVGLGKRRQATQEGAKVKPRAPDQQRHSSGGVYLGDCPLRIFGELCCGIGFLRLANVDETVRRTREDLRSRFAGADVHASVDHRGVHADDVDGKRRGELDRHVGLSGRRRAHEAKQRALTRLGVHGRPANLAATPARRPTDPAAFTVASAPRWRSHRG